MEEVENTPEGRVLRFSAPDGLMLAARVFGEPAEDRLTLLCLSGLSRNSKDFIRIGRRLGSEAEAPRQVIALDYRGRGLSDYDPDWSAYNPLTEAQDVMAAAAALGIGEAVVLGTSRGGIIAMLLGALRPALLAGVILNDIGPVIEGAGVARIRTYLSIAEPPSDWNAARAVIHRVAGGNGGIPPDDVEAFTRATFLEKDGRLHADFDRNLLRTLQSLEFQDPLPTMWPQFESLARIPVLSIRGARSDILSGATLAEMAARHPDFAAFEVRGQGHAPLLMDPATIARIDAFSRTCDDRVRRRGRADADARL